MGDFPAEMETARRAFLRLAEVGNEWSNLIKEVGGGELIVDNVAAIVMCRLHEGGALRPLELQESIAITSGGMSKLIDRLEEGGLVARLAAKPAEDRRGVRIVLTRKGDTLLREVLAAIAPRVRQVSADLVHILADVEYGYAPSGSSDPGADGSGVEE